MKIAVMIVQLLCALFLIVVIMLQSGKNSGLGGSFGQSQTTGFGAQAKSKTWDAKFARMTKWVALAFVLLTLVLLLLK